MPLPSPNDKEKTKDFVQRCMSDDTMKKEYPDGKQRTAVCYSKSNKLEDTFIEKLDAEYVEAHGLWDDECNEFIFQVEANMIYDEEGLLIFAAKKGGKTVTLNKPFRTPDGPKKFSVYVKNQKGNVVKVNFGDPNMKIKKSNPKRRKSFRARHNCDNPGPKWKARYWSCKKW